MDGGSLCSAPSPGRHLRAQLTSRPHRGFFPRLEGFHQVMKMVVFGMVQWILCLVSALSFGEGGTAAVFELKSSDLPPEHIFILVFIEILLKAISGLSVAPVVILYGRLRHCSSLRLLRTRIGPWTGQVFSSDSGGVGERAVFQQK